MLTHQDAKRQAARIAARLRALGHDISTNHGLQALAAAHDYPDWNRMLAAIERAHAPSVPTRPELAPRRHLHAPQRAAPTRPTLLIGRIGSGKTTALALRMAIERQRGGRCLYISLGSDAAASLPPSLRHGTQSVTIEGWYRSETELAHRVTWGAATSAAPSLLVTVDITGWPRRFEATQTGLATLLAKLPALLAEGPVDLTACSLVALDEAHRVLCADTADRIVNEVLPTFTACGAELVVATQDVLPAVLASETRRRLGSVLVDESLLRHPSRHHLQDVGQTCAHLVSATLNLDDDRTLTPACVATVWQALHGMAPPVGAGARMALAQALLSECAALRERVRPDEAPSGSATPALQ